MDLPSSAEKIVVGNREIYLVGTAHVSMKSVEDVSAVVAAVNPDAVCIELCQGRMNSIRDRDAWRKMDIFKVIKEKKVPLLLAQLVLSSFYRKLGKQLEVAPGAEMIRGAEEAERLGITLVLADRAIDVTLKRVWGGLSFFQKMMFMFDVFPAMIFSTGKIDAEEIERLKEADHLETAMAELAKAFPAIKERLITERDIYLAEKIRTAPGERVVAVVGAGHVAGIKRYINSQNDLAPLMVVPRKSIIGPILSWGIPVAIVAMIIFGFTKSAAMGEDSLWIWVLCTGGFGALGALAAWAHPLAILLTFILSPIQKAGWAAGLLQAWLHKPTVADLEAVPEAAESLKGFWGNALIRILLIVTLVGLGVWIGRFLAVALIAKRIFS